MNQNLAQIKLVVKDYDEAIDFYVNKLAFELLEDTKRSESKRWVRVAPKGTNGFSLLLSKAKNEAQLAAVGNQTGGGVFLFLYTDDIWRDYKLMKSTKNTVYELKKKVEELCGQSLSLKDNNYELQVLVRHALLKNSNLSESVFNDCPQNADELVNAVLDTPNVHYTNRLEHINDLASGICTILNDKQSYKFWCSLLWKAHKYLVKMGIDHFKTIANVVMRAEVAVREGKQKGGAYAYELLKGFKLFQSFSDAAI